MTARTLPLTPSRQFTRPWIATLTVVTLGLAVLLTSVVQQHRTQARVTDRNWRAAPLVTFSTTAYSEADVRDRDIAFYAERVEQDRSSATDRLTLAGLLFTRSRTTGSVSDLARAEVLARESVALREQRNGQAFEVLASVLMARHAFQEAHDVAARADSLDPGTPSHLALLGEIELERGDYDAAAVHFKGAHYDGQQFTIGARLARWYELTGHVDIARQLLSRASVNVDRRDDLPREQVAWFHYRLGELELRVGNFRAADSAFHIALLRNPDDVRALGGLARVALARKDFAHAVEYGERGTGILLDPTTLGTVSRAYAALGDSAQSSRYAQAMSVSAIKQPGVIHRAWGLFLLDYGTASERAEVLRRARRELRDRKDVYGHDLLAWALYRTGHVAEARVEMAMALAQHTEDAMLTTHARAIGVE